MNLESLICLSVQNVGCALTYALILITIYRLIQYLLNHLLPGARIKHTGWCALLVA